MDACMIAVTVLLPARCVEQQQNINFDLPAACRRRDGFPFFHTHMLSSYHFNSRFDVCVRERARCLSNVNKSNWQHSYCDRGQNQVNTELSFLFTSYYEWRC